MGVHDAEVTAKQVDELRQVIDPGEPEEIADPRCSATRYRVCLEPRQIKPATTRSDARQPFENRPGALQLDHRRANEHQRQGETSNAPAKTRTIRFIRSHHVVPETSS